MPFDIDKCAKVLFRKGRPVKSKNTEITELGRNKADKYLGINEANFLINTINK